MQNSHQWSSHQNGPQTLSNGKELISILNGLHENSKIAAVGFLSLALTN